MIRPEFRFPKATAPLMALILALVVMTIEKANAISASVPHISTQVGPIPPMQFTLVLNLLVVVIVAGTMGTLSWAVLFALRRSGMHRLSESNPSSSSHLTASH